ncbi:MAG TPA: hypothetical protein VH325_09635 [Bryobacteraceae bacterium]|jgi:hypothetical protein|nr:hypothetical protein [Bryobacteraceae bacterium]
MLPLSLLAAQKLANLLTNANLLTTQISQIAAETNVNIPTILPAQVVLSSATPDIADLRAQMSYPRVCIYSDTIKNTQVEKFRSLSGTIGVTAEVWASGTLVQQTDQWIHYYVEALTLALRQNIGDWQDGLFFSGIYTVQFQQPKAGGLGYVQSAKITCSLGVSLN